MMDVGRVRTVLGCRNPDRQVSAAGRSELLPRPFGVGEPVAYVQAPKAKGHRSLSIGFRTPRPRVIGLFAGAHRRRFPWPSGGVLVLASENRAIPRSHAGVDRGSLNAESSRPSSCVCNIRYNRSSG